GAIQGSRFSPQWAKKTPTSRSPDAAKPSDAWKSWQQSRGGHTPLSRTYAGCSAPVYLPSHPALDFWSVKYNHVKAFHLTHFLFVSLLCRTARTLQMLGPATPLRNTKQKSAILESQFSFFSVQETRRYSLVSLRG
ncbi:unnamed protein product, partial [Gulo gulo]